MSFFNKKEEVISIELTPYGRHLLSLGKLQPSYYAFYDDDILYNPESAGGLTSSAEIKDRILTDTSYLKPTYIYESLDKIITESETYLDSDHIRYPSSNNKIYYLQKPMGTMAYSAITNPAFQATFIQNEISSSSKFYNSNAANPQGGVGQTPQIDVNFSYTLSIMSRNDEASKSNVVYVKPEFKSKVFQDQTYLNVEFEKMIVQLLENNSFDYTNNFDVEVFKIDDNNVNKMQQLKFLPRGSNIKNNLLVDEETVNNVMVDKNYVEYYFNLLVDDEIAVADICEGVTQLKSENVFVDLDVECPDLVGRDINIYSSRITPDDIEDCD